MKLKNGVVMTVFHVRGNEYRLLTSILYQRQDVDILDVLTQAEYAKAGESDYLGALTLLVGSANSARRT